MQNQKSYSLAGRKLFVALPAYDFKVSLKLAVSLARLAQMLPGHGIELSIGSVCGCSVVSRARNLLVKDFLETDCTDLMFIDADINFEPDDVLRLMAWSSDAEKGIVGGVPRTRKTNKVYIAQLDQDEEGLTMNRMGLVRAKRIATAFMMVRRDVFERLVNDYLFCDRARAIGYEIWIDPTIKLGHMGVQEYEGDFGADVLYPMVVPVAKAA
jgi:hypothetical protein